MSPIILAVDHGTKRIGLAATDALGFVLPLPLLESEGDEAAAVHVAAVAREREAATVLVGMPINMDGSRGPAALKVEKFCQMIEKALGEGSGVAVLRRDERLSSVEAESVLAQGRVHWRDRKGKVDTLAAQLILRDYLAETDPSYRQVPEDAPPDPEKQRRADRRDRRRGKDRR